jgi:hypothetical protein
MLGWDERSGGSDYCILEEGECGDDLDPLPVVGNRAFI